MGRGKVTEKSDLSYQLYSSLLLLHLAWFLLAEFSFLGKLFDFNPWKLHEGGLGPLETSPRVGNMLSRLSSYILPARKESLNWLLR